MLHADGGAFLVVPIDEIMARVVGPAWQEAAAAHADRGAASASEIDDHVSDRQVGLLSRALNHTALEPV
jgi:hypothetical protein